VDFCCWLILEFRLLLGRLLEKKRGGEQGEHGEKKGELGVTVGTHAVRPVT
jgi:hypothetical protein